jgi:hypothetical protein
MELLATWHPAVGPWIGAGVVTLGGAAKPVEVVSPTAVVSVRGAIFETTMHQFDNRGALRLRNEIDLDGG